MTVPPDFPWRAGMLVLATGTTPPIRLVNAPGLPEDCKGDDAIASGIAVGRPGDMHRDFYILGEPGDAPDLTDGATKGALLEAVREAYGVRRLSVSWVPWGCQVLALNTYQNEAYDYSILGEGADDGAALLAAWEARPGRGA